MYKEKQNVEKCKKKKIIKRKRFEKGSKDQNKNPSYSKK